MATPGNWRVWAKKILKQFHIGGQRGDTVALTFARELGRRQSAQRGERLGTEECEQMECHIVVQILFNVSGDATQKSTDNHHDDGGRNAHAPHRITGRVRKSQR